MTIIRILVFIVLGISVARGQDTSHPTKDKWVSCGSAQNMLGFKKIQAASTSAPGSSQLDSFHGASVAEAASALGGKRVLCLGAAFQNQPVPYSPDALLTNMLSCSNFFRRVSYGKTWLEPVIPPTFELPGTLEFYIANFGQAWVDILSASESAGYYWANYDFILFHTPYVGGVSSAAGKGLHLNGEDPTSAFAHELGHLYGLQHANLWSPLSGTGYLGHRMPGRSGFEYAESFQYHDLFDIMGFNGAVSPGGVPIYPFGDPDMRNKALLRWIEPQDIRIITANGRYRVHRFDHPNAPHSPSTPLALRLQTETGEELWIGVRHNFTTPNLGPGAYLIWAPTFNPWHYYLDCTPLSQPYGYSLASELWDGFLLLNRSYLDPSATVRITHVGSGGTEPTEYIDLDIEFLHKGQPFRLFTDAAKNTPGIVGSYFNSPFTNYLPFADWSVKFPAQRTGQRTDPQLSFLTSGWGSLASVGFGAANGTDGDWDNFSVQWDGVIQIDRHVVLGLKSYNGSRMWIDVNRNNFQESSELLDNIWNSDHDGVWLSAATQPLMPGDYKIRIQYAEGTSSNTLRLVWNDIPYYLTTAETPARPGLVGSYINRSLRDDLFTSYRDWRSDASGARLDLYPIFFSSGWGSRSEVGLSGDDLDWDNFSVQWDGRINILSPTRFALWNDDSSAMYIDRNSNGQFDTSLEFGEYFSNVSHLHAGEHFGPAAEMRLSGSYLTRIQYAEELYNNRIMFSGTPVQVPDPAPNYAVCFHGANDALLPSNRIGISNDFTIEFWFQSTQVAGGESQWWQGMGIIDGEVAGVSNDFGISLGNGRILFGIGGGFDTTIRSSFIADGNWHHVAATRQRSNGAMRLYIDGVLAASGTGSTVGLDVHGRMGSLQTGINFFRGALDEIRVWNIVRTGTEIQALRHSSGFQQAGTLIRYWDCHEGRGTLIQSGTFFADFTNSVAWVLSGAKVGPVSSNELEVANLNDYGSGSLRNALGAAVLLPGNQTVRFAPTLSGKVIHVTNGPFNLIKTSGTITVTASNLVPGVGISGDYRSRLFSVAAGANVLFDSLTLSNGYCLNDVLLQNGGALLNEGTSTVMNCTFTLNIAPKAGGAIHNAGNLNLRHCTFYRNIGVEGGALNSTAGHVEAAHCTFHDNVSDRQASGSRGGAIACSGSATLSLSHTILGANTAALDPELSITRSYFSSGGYNFVSQTDKTLLNWQNTDWLGSSSNPENPFLSSLVYLGGSTPVCVPAGGSAAIDRGAFPSSAIPLRDQRNLPRLHAPRIDIGSAENLLRAFYNFDNQTASDKVQSSSVTYSGCGQYWATDVYFQPASAFDVEPSCGDALSLATRVHSANASGDLGLQNSFTIMAWVYARALDGYRVVLGSDGAGGPGTLHVGIRDGNAFFGMWNNDLDGVAQVPINEWVHLAWVFDAAGGLMSILINGQLDNTDSWRINTVKNGNLVIGRCPAIAGSSFSGGIDDFAIFAGALSASQIRRMAFVLPPGEGLPELQYPLPDPPSCGWLVREIFNPPVFPWNLAGADAVATALLPSATYTQYVSAVISRKDPEAPGGAGLFDLYAWPYAANNRTASGLNSTDDDGAVLIARTRITIPQAGTYTFGFASDDGASLRIKNAYFTNSVSFRDANPASPPHRGDTLRYPVNTGQSHTLGIVHLPAGSYELEFLSWEATGGSMCEVFAARGAKTNFDSSFSLVAGGTLSVPKLQILSFPQSIRLQWSPTNTCYRLERAFSLKGPWASYGSGSPTFDLPSPGTARFYRLVQ